MSSNSGDPVKNHFAVILAGGAGTRLWPLSTLSRPKHLLSVLNDSSTLLQATVHRVMAMVEASSILTVTGHEHESETVRQLAAVSEKLTEGVLTEPVGRNTLPAVAWAVYKIAERCPSALISVFPSDHLIKDTAKFQSVWKLALKAASKGFLMTFGIVPDTPETGYGYIKAAETLPMAGCRRVATFVEKPNEVAAKEYVASGEYYWNSGMFVFSARLFLEELRTHQPDLEEVLKRLPDGYASLQSLSIDYGLMEKSRRICVVPAEMSWSDLGNWDAVYRALPHDGAGNAVQGRVLSHDTSSSLLISEHGLLAVAGIRNAAVIQTQAAVLVADLGQSQRIKSLVQDIQKTGPGPTETTPVNRPWGSYTVLEESNGYKIKKICVNPGQKLSLQRHQYRAEHWVVIEGTARVTCGEKILEMNNNESTFIPQGEIHRLENRGKKPLVIIEVQTGSYVGEDDIIRIDDIYGRSVNR